MRPRKKRVLRKIIETPIDDDDASEEEALDLFEGYSNSDGFFFFLSEADEQDDFVGYEEDPPLPVTSDES